jgi:hypothetical protein
MTTECVALNKIWRAVSQGETRLFRNNVGEAWAGKSYHYDSRVIIESPYRIHYGLTVGSADLIGWTQYTIQPEDVGRKVAVFTSVEVKGPRGRASEEQLHWQATVKISGGIATVARTPHDAAEAIEEYRPRIPYHE